MIDYKEQVFNISIKTNIQYSICYTLQEKKESMT